MGTPWHRQGGRVKGEPKGTWSSMANRREKDQKQQAKEARALEARRKKRLGGGS